MADVKTNPRLKKCPFCGVRAYYIERSEDDHIIECGHCGVTMEGLSRRDVVRYWNMREPCAECEALIHDLHRQMDINLSLVNEQDAARSSTG